MKQIVNGKMIKEKHYKSYLVAPARTKYKPKFGAGKCIFCMIANDDPNVLKKVLYKNDFVMLIMNIFPYNKGHLEVVPVRHVREIYELNESELSHMTKGVSIAIKLLRVSLDPGGFNIGINLGFIAGESIDHLHIHIVPRYIRETGFMEVVDKTKVMGESIDEIYEILKLHLKDVLNEEKK